MEKGYQSAHGIELDLMEILHQYRNNEEVEPFELGVRDHSDRFLIPSKLYGRSNDVSELIQTFNEVCKGEMKLSLVSGYSGVGKTSLVQELYRPLAIAKGRYIHGKFDQYQRDVPYSALAYAFNGFCSLVLAESDEEVAEWKKKILEAVGNNGQVLIEVVPHLEGILGKQPPVPEVDPQAAKNRFNQVLYSFMSHICSEGHPLVLFLDDLQWIDQASLEYLRQILLNDPIPGLHLVGAYRDNEVEDRHPLSLLLGELEKSGVKYDVVHLGNLNIYNLTELVSETLSLPSK